MVEEGGRKTGAGRLTAGTGSDTINLKRSVIISALGPIRQLPPPSHP